MPAFAPSNTLDNLWMELQQGSVLESGSSLWYKNNLPVAEGCGTCTQSRTLRIFDYGGKKNLAVFLLILVGLSSGTRSLAADPASWPQFHGPKGDNHSPASGLLKKWPSEGPKLAWTAKDIGTGFSSVTLSGGMIYIAGNVGDDTVITALGHDGVQKWQAKCGKAWTAGPR